MRLEHVWTQLAMRRNCLPSGLRLADHFDIAAVGDEHRDAVPEQQMIVDNQHADGFSHANRVRSTCQSHPLTTADEWTCVVAGPVVDTAMSISYDTESRNQIAHVNLALQVRKGTLRLTYYDLSGQQHMLVTPTMPVNLVMKTPMRNRAFSVFYEPINGPVEGLTGTVKYSTP